MDTSKFKTKTEFIFRNNGKTKKVFGLAVDIGYSGTKLFGPNIVARFPSYAKKVSEDFSFITALDDDTIIYTDNVTGERWLVGEAAQNQIKATDTSDSEAALYGRERYGSPMFKVIARVGLGIGMLNKEYKSDFNPEEKTLVVQTGLPERYLDMDKGWLTESISGHHSFTLQIGNHSTTFDFDLLEENIYVMSQPKGTLYSVCKNRDGSWHEDAKKYMKSSVLVFDPGFGTFDLFPINEGAVTGVGETFADLGMRRVMQETVARIKKQYAVEISVPAMQKYLATGTYSHIDRRSFEAVNIDFSDILKEANEFVFNEAMTQMLNVFDLNDYSYIIVTGGTGAAWLPMIREKFAKPIELGVIKILNGNQNDTLPFVYSNVRGYYLFRFSKLKELYGVE